MFGLTDADSAGGETHDGGPSLFRRLRSAFLIVGICAGLGALAPLAALQFADNPFRAEAHIAVHDASPNAVRAAIVKLRSRPVIDNLIRALNLAEGEEFSANRPTVVRIVSEVLSGDVTTVSQAEEALRQRLSDAVAITYDAAGQTIAIRATAASPEEAAAIANRLAEEFERAMTNGSASPPNPQVEAMRNAADRAEAALSGFVARLGGATLEKLQQFHDERNAVAAELQDAERHLADMTAKQQAAAAMKFADVLSKPLPDSLEFTGLEYQRQRYVQAQLDLEQLSANLGPRHPRRAAAQAALDDAGRDIGTALRQLATSLQNQTTAAAKTLAELEARKKNVLQDRQLAEDYTQLLALQGAADEARMNLDKAEANAASRPPSAMPTIRVTSEASSEASGAAAARDLPNRSTLMAGGALLGLAAGVVLAMRRYRTQLRLADEAYEAPVRLDIDDADVIPAVSEEVPAGSDSFATDPVADEHGFEERLAANDTTFGDRIRALLQENRHPVAEASLPSLLAAAVDQSRSRRADDPMQDRSPRDWSEAGYEPHPDEEELLALQRELAELRELVQYHAARQLKAAS